MRTLLNEIATIDEYLLGRMTDYEARAFEAKMRLNDHFRNDVEHQRNTHLIISQYGRNCIKREIQSVQARYMDAPQHRSIINRIIKLFSPG